jgi:hypothetical protein
MKKLIVVCMLIIGSVVANAQNPFKGFFKPVEKDLFTNPDVMSVRGISDTTKGVWLFKFDAEITAIQLQYENVIKDDGSVVKEWTSSPLSSVGPGIGYRHYIQYNGEPYCNFGVNALVLVGYDWESISAADIALVGTITFLDFVNVGGGYNFGSYGNNRKVLND